MASSCHSVRKSDTGTLWRDLDNSFDSQITISIDPANQMGNQKLTHDLFLWTRQSDSGYLGFVPTTYRVSQILDTQELLLWLIQTDTGQSRFIRVTPSDNQILSTQDLFLDSDNQIPTLYEFSRHLMQTIRYWFVKTCSYDSIWQSSHKGDKKGSLYHLWWESTADVLVIKHVSLTSTAWSPSNNLFQSTSVFES